MYQYHRFQYFKICFKLFSFHVTKNYGNPSNLMAKLSRDFTQNVNLMVALNGKVRGSLKIIRIHHL